MSPIKVIGQVHFPPDDDTTIVYRTTNNGDSYTPVNQWGTHYGIGYPGEVRRWWGSPNQGLYGSLTGPDISENLQSYNWVQMFHPSLPLPGTKWGYGRELINSKILFDSRFPIYQPSTYLFFKANPHASVIIELEYEWDTITNKSISVRSWIHQTDDDWKTWHTIWESGRFEWADQIFLDEKSPSLWAITKFRSDTSFVGYNADRYTSFLYKHAIKLSVNPTYNSLPTAPLRVFPTPTNGPLKILLQIHNSHIISLQLSNAEGKIFAQTTNNFLFSEDIIEWSVPEYVPSGLYFVTIRTDNSIYLVKLILQR